MVGRRRFNLPGQVSEDVRSIERRATIANAKKRYFTLILVAGVLTSGFGQSLLKLPAHTSLNTTPWYDTIYQYPDFLPGRMTFSTGFSPQGTVPMNYNLYFLKIDFINEHGDTLQIKPPRELMLVEIGNHLYFNGQREGFMEVLSKGAVSLAVKRYLATDKMDYVSGTTYSGTPVDERGTISNYDRYYRLAADYYFIDTNNKAQKATQTALIKSLPARRKEVRHYLKENEIDFNDGEALMNLLSKIQQ